MVTKKASVVLALLLVGGCVPAATTPSAEAPTGAPGTAPATPSGSEAAPPGDVPSQALIAADLESGDIDLGTSLQLRAWALFGDPRLPERYDGAGSSGEDLALFEEIAANLDGLPDAQRTDLERYLRRPTDTASAWSAAGEATGGAIRQASVTTAVEDEPAPVPCAAPRRWLSQEWSPGASPDQGFAVWACGPNMATVRGDLEAVLAIGSRLWGPMTRPMPDGMGLPVPDTLAPQSGGSGKVDVYLLDAHAECPERGTACRPIPGDGVAAAVLDRPLNCAMDGFPAKGCSGYLLLGRGRLGGADFAADFAHEFFHVLQFAHNGHIDSTWYTEASAVWAEWTYEREAAEAAAYNHYRRFQAENRSLLWYDYSANYQYRAWGWPLFQSTQDGAASVFQAWQGIEAATTREDVDRAVGDQLPFETAFRDFAVRNAQPAAYIPPASTGLDTDRWQTKADLSDFPTDPHRVTHARSAVTLGKERHAAEIDPLTAQYDEYEVVDEDVREIEIDISELSGADQADLDVLAQVGGGDSWRRFKSGHALTLCRDQADEDVGFFQVVISNHERARNGNFPDFEKQVRGTYTIEARNECEPHDPYLGGTITWDAVRDDGYRTVTVSGRLELVLHRDGYGTWISERGEGSTYTYDVQTSDCSPDGHHSGVVETGVGRFEPEWRIASALVSETEDSPPDLELAIHLFDEWVAMCSAPNGEPYETTLSAAGYFPGCDSFARVTAENDGSGNYTIACDIAHPYDSTWSGRISGELHPIDGPQPTDGG